MQSKLLLTIFLTCVTFNASADNNTNKDLKSEQPKISVGAKSNAAKQEISKSKTKTTPGIAKIEVYFKLDPLLTRGLYIGDRWVSPETFANVLQIGNQGVVEIKAVGVNSRGEIMQKQLVAHWLPTNPDLVKVSQPKGNAITLTTLQPGESTLVVMAEGVSSTLTINAEYRKQDNRTIVKITKKNQRKSNREQNLN
jgi:hypothetical protein